jgi:hypothetical protein
MDKKRRCEIFMIEVFRQKIIHNRICAHNGCGRQAKVRIKFSLGFSAGFCEDCGTQLTNAGIGTLDEE